MATKRVLVVDDDRAVQTALLKRCRALGVEAEASPDGLHALMTMAQNPPDLIILDINMPAVNGLMLSEKLAHDELLASIPIIAVTGRSDDETVRRCAELGLRYVRKGVDTWTEIQSIICDLLGIQAPQTSTAGQTDILEDSTPQPAADGGRPKVLVIDDDLALLKALEIRLSACGIEVFTASNGKEGFFTAVQHVPDVIITDYTMPEGYGNYVISRLQRHSVTQNIPIIVLTGRTIGDEKDFGLERAMMGAGAVGFLIKPLDFDKLLCELERFIDVPTRHDDMTCDATKQEKQLCSL